MKKIIATAIIATIAAFAAACASSSSTNTANAVSNKNAVSANTANSNSRRDDEHGMDMTNRNHSEMNYEQMRKQMNMKPETRNDANRSDK